LLCDEFKALLHKTARHESTQWS